ncbi:MAG: hypothetical protein O3A66_02880, partial [Proteobacteria bacterium]|nr:hypothetical protein [Pseudomonadota bacterium]
MQKNFSEVPFDGYFIPFSAHIDEKTVISKSGLISQTIKIMPTSHTAFKQDIISALKKLLTPDTLINIHALHSNSAKYGYGSFEDYLRLSQMRHLSSHSEYEHEFYITISIPGYKIDKSSVSNFLLQNRFLMETQKGAKVLHSIVTKFCNDIQKYLPKVLTLLVKNDVVYSANSAFLYRVLFATTAQIPIADIETSEQIKPASIKRRRNFLIIKRGEDKRYIACLTIKDFPHINAADIVKVFTSKHAFTLSQTIHHARNNEIRPLFEYQSRTTSSLRGNKIADMTSWNEILIDPNPIALQTNITLYGENTEELENDVTEMSKTLANIGIVAVREDINLEQTFYASLPANPTFLNRIEFATLSHAGQFLLSKNMLFSGVDEIQHLPFMPVMATGGKYHAISPFTVHGSKHILLHGIQSHMFCMFLNTLLLNITQEVRTICLDTNYSSLALNRLRGGIYLQDLQVNILNLLKHSRKHFFVFFSHLVDFFLKQENIENTEEIRQSTRDFCLKLKPEMNFKQVKTLTTRPELHSMLDFANENNFFAETDVFETKHNFISINTDKIPNGMYSMKTLYVMLANLYYTNQGTKSILKFDRTFECFYRSVIPQELFIEIMHNSKQLNVSIIACTSIPEQFERDRTFIYSDVFSKFDITIFTESICSTQFIK